MSKSKNENYDPFPMKLICKNSHGKKCFKVNLDLSRIVMVKFLSFLINKIRSTATYPTSYLSIQETIKLLFSDLCSFLTIDTQEFR